eukprot:TRINITY_DN13555_c0_g1_i2.p1 TRINITY_DN13555_c0_g1~~TRINITY_DN13555_c0_g1_i2.p1  ORF type:complete len:225 (-),score=38.19 TRINITY_DN13555_c0_g1_i2:171-845(-)
MDGGLPQAFLQYLQSHMEVLDSVRAWQEANRHLFTDTETGELRLEATIAYKDFVALVDTHISAFLVEYGASMEDFSEALMAMRSSQDPQWRAFDLMLQKVDFPSFADLVRKDVCLCCGGSFRGQTPNRVGLSAVPPPMPVGDLTPPPVPEGWAAHVDPATGAVFYQNLADGSTTWETPTRAPAPAADAAPVPVPEGWAAHTDAATGKVYYQNLADGSTTWEMPA